MSGQRGVTLISVLMATALTGILIITVLTLIDQVTLAISRATALDNIEAAVRTVQGVIANRELCDNALRMATNDNNGKLNFRADPATGEGIATDFNNIYAQAASGDSATQVLFRNQNIGGGYFVLDMEFRERSPYVGPPFAPPWNTSNGRGQLRLGTGPGAITYTTVAGQIMLRFGPQTSSAGATAMQDRFIPYNAVIHPGPDNVSLTADDYIDRCYQDSNVQYMCEQLGGTYDLNDGSCDTPYSSVPIDCQGDLSGTPNDCPPGNPPSATCTNIYYVAGFNNDSTGPDVLATPICRCQKVCVGVGGGTGATATAASAAPASSNLGITAGGAIDPVVTSGGGN